MKIQPKPQQEPPRPPTEATEAPRPSRPRWPERLNTALLAIVCAVIAVLIGVRVLGSAAARAVWSVAARPIRWATPRHATASRRLARRTEVAVSHLMDYGPDWRPRKPRVFDRRFWICAAIPVITLVIIAAMATLSDRPARVDFTPTVASTPRSHHPGNP